MLFLFAVYLGALSVLLPFIGGSFGLGSAAEGRLFPANFSGFVVGVLLCGYLSDRFGRKAVLLLGIAVYALGLVLFGMASSFTTALAAAALIGAGSGAMEIVASALAADLYPERRAFILNLLQIAFGVGAALSPALAHALLTAGMDWHRLYLALAGADAVLLLALAVQRVPAVAHAPEGLDWATLRAVLHQPVFLKLCMAEMLYVGAETGFACWMPTYFEKHLAGGAAWAGLVVSVFWVAVTMGRIATGRQITRVPLLTLASGLALGGTAGTALALATTIPAVVMLGVALTGLCFSGIFGLILAQAGECYPGVAGTVFGGIVAAGGIGGAVFPWVVGILATTPLGWRGALTLIPFLSLGIVLLIRPMKR